MNSSLVIWGAGGHGKVVLDVARNTGHFECILFFVDVPADSGMPFCGCKLIVAAHLESEILIVDEVLSVGTRSSRRSAWERCRT